MAYKLITFDLDGTFLRDDKSIPPENLRALWAAAERGVILVPATGRTFSGIPEEIKSLPFIRWIIAVNGAYVLDAKEDRILYKGEIPLDVALRVLDYMDGLPVLYDCYQDGQGWVSARMYEQAAEYFASEPHMLSYFYKMRTPVPDLRQALIQRQQPVQKMQMHFKPSQEALRQEQMQKVPQIFPELTASSSLSNNVELNSVNAGKGRALSVLCDFLGLDLRETVAFGDGSNDAPLLRAAGLGIAVENAAPVVKAEAGRFTASNNAGGVAQAIRALLEESAFDA